ncbi:MAG: hypothetical protein ABEH47_01425 [Haloferacaceae archaeon]
MAPALPDQWHEVESPDHVVEKYRAREPTLFVREDHDVGVHVLPVSTSSPHDEERYRTGAIRGDRDEFDREVPVETYDDHEAALEAALEFAVAYEAAYDECGEETTAVERAAAAVS